MFRNVEKTSLSAATSAEDAVFAVEPEGNLFVSDKKENNAKAVEENLSPVVSWF